MAKMYRKETDLSKKYASSSATAARKKKFFIIPFTLMAIGILGVFSQSFVAPDPSLQGMRESNTFYIMAFLGIVSYYIISRITGIRFDRFRLVSEESEILRAGVEGEEQAFVMLEKLSEAYTVVPDVNITTTSGSSQLDYVVISESGVWVVETKNHKGTIIGKVDAREWKQIKIGRRGTEYSESFYNPLKQVATHVFRLKEFLHESGIQSVPWISGVVLFTHGQVNVDVISKDNNVLQGQTELLDYFARYEQDVKATSVPVAEIVRALLNTARSGK